MRRLPSQGELLNLESGGTNRMNEIDQTRKRIQRGGRILYRGCKIGKSIVLICGLYLLSILNEEEYRAILRHEFYHILNEHQKVYLQHLNIFLLPAQPLFSSHLKLHPSC